MGNYGEGVMNFTAEHRETAKAPENPSNG